MSVFENILKIGEKSSKSLSVFKDMNNFQKGFCNSLGNFEGKHILYVREGFVLYHFLSKTNEQLAKITHWLKIVNT